MTSSNASFESLPSVIETGQAGFVQDFTTASPLERAAHSLRRALSANERQWRYDGENYEIFVNSEVISQIFSENVSVLLKCGEKFPTILSILALATEGPVFVGNPEISLIGLKPGNFRYAMNKEEISDLFSLVQKFATIANVKKRKISARIEKIFYPQISQVWIFPDARHVVDDEILSEISSRPATEVKINISPSSSHPSRNLPGWSHPSRDVSNVVVPAEVVETVFGKSASAAFSALAKNKMIGNFFPVFVRYLKFLIQNNQLGISDQKNISGLKNISTPKIQNILNSIDGNYGFEISDLENASESEISDAILFERGQEISDQLICRVTGPATKAVVVERNSARAAKMGKFSAELFVDMISDLLRDVEICESLEISDQIVARVLRGGGAVVDGPERAEIEKKISDQNVLRKVYQLESQGKGVLRAVKRKDGCFVATKLPIV